MSNFPTVEWLLMDLGNTLVQIAPERIAPNLRRVFAARQPERLPTVDELQAFFFAPVPGGSGEDRNTAINRGTLLLPDAAEQLGKAFGTELPYAEVETAWCDMFPGPIHAMLDAVAAARAAGVRVAMTSDTNEPHIRHQRRIHPVCFAHIDVEFLSHEMGAIKTDPTYFATVLDHTGAAPESHLLVDDLQRNVDSARAAGMQAWLFTGTVPARPPFS